MQRLTPKQRCANLATVDLNALLYKFEMDIGTAIQNVFDDSLEMEDEFVLQPFPYSSSAGAQVASTSRKQSSDEWYKRAAYRKQQMDHYLWNEGKSLYFDYDTVTRKQSLYESVTAFWTLWAGCASEEQAWRLMCVSRPPCAVLG